MTNTQGLRDAQHIVGPAKAPPTTAHHRLVSSLASSLGLAVVRAPKQKRERKAAAAIHTNARNRGAERASDAHKRAEGIEARR